MPEIIKVFQLVLPEEDFNHDNSPPGILCEECRLIIQPNDTSHEETAELAAFISEHQHHGPIRMCYLNEDEEWVPTPDVMTRPDS